VRIAITNWSRRKVGGAEIYLNGIIPGLVGAGHTVGFWHEVDLPANREQIGLPDHVPAWCVSDLGRESALAELRQWHPDVIYAHGLSDPTLEAETLTIAPAVFFAHGYYGTCISGAKTFKNPVVTPCSRRFGWQCLFHYYPHRCGGWSPVTMLREYRRQSRRLELLSSYRAIVTHSNYMRFEYTKHGLACDRIHYTYDTETIRTSPYPVEECEGLDPRSPSAQAAETTGNASTGTRTTPSWRLLFMGRMDFLKGGRTFLEALPQVRAFLDRPLRVTFAGDGPDRQGWERQAEQVQAQNEGLQIEFVGWMNGSQRDSLFARCDLLVLPSLWPEPFGLVGPEAGLCGVPAAGYAVGGIPDWLTDGVNGHLAPGNPPTAAGLAEAIIKCLRDPCEYARLRHGATEVARRFSPKRHLVALLEVFEKAVGCK
jgi:glycosyltransferase involved in cell wall biosynthesis